MGIDRLDRLIVLPKIAWPHSEIWDLEIEQLPGAANPNEMVPLINCALQVETLSREEQASHVGREDEKHMMQH